MKKANKTRKSTKNDNNIKPKIFITAAILAVIILVGVLFQFTNIGQAVKIIDAPSDVLDEDSGVLKEINMAAYEAIEINVETIETLNFKMQTTAGDKAESFEMTLSINEEGVLNYFLINTKNQFWAKGLLGGTVLSTGNLYLDGDELPDTQLSFSNGYLKILNANYIEPDASKVTVINGITKKHYAEDEKIIPAKKGQPLYLTFNVTSTVVPEVTAYWENGSSLTAEQFTVLEIGENYTTLNFTWTPLENTAYTLIVEAVTGDKVTKETYTLSVGGFIYALEEPNYPTIKAKIIVIEEGKYQTILTFSGNSNLPFSIPCGTLDLDANAHALTQIEKIYSYKQDTQVWEDKIPSEFSSLEENKGYLLKLKKGGTATLTIDCSLGAGTNPPLDLAELTSLPDLKAGWNLVGIGGYLPVSMKKMITKVPPQHQIVKAYTISNSGVIFEEITEFEPGKAYWIKIGPK
jgi:hypothetical protein